MATFLGSRKASADDLISFYNGVFPNTSRKEEKATVKTYDDLSRNAKLCYDALETQPGCNVCRRFMVAGFELSDLYH